MIKLNTLVENSRARFEVFTRRIIYCLVGETIENTTTHAPLLREVSSHLTSTVYPLNQQSLYLKSTVAIPSFHSRLVCEGSRLILPPTPACCARCLVSINSLSFESAVSLLKIDSLFDLQVLPPTVLGNRCEVSPVSLHSVMDVHPLW